MTWMLLRAVSWLGWAAVQFRRGLDQVVDAWKNP
jgi:hypothetical protein